MMYFIGDTTYKKYDTLIAAIYDLPFNSKVYIEELDDSFLVKVNCPVWINKAITLTPTYSKKFTKEEIFRDMAPKIFNKFGYSIFIGRQ